MFHDLETASDDLALNGYGISITSLEEVFMKVGTETPALMEASPKPATNGGTFGSDDGESMSSDNVFADNQRLVKGSNLAVSQWRSMILKKYLYTLRNKLMFAIQNLMPILFIVMTIVVAKMSSFAPLKPITPSLTQYPTTVTVLDNSSVTSGTLGSEISLNYMRVLDSYSDDHELVVTGPQGFIKYMLKLGQTMQIRINRRYIAAATVRSNNITAWLNNKPLHSAPLTVNLIHNALAKTFISDKASIEVVNAPLPFTKESELDLLNTGQNLGTQIALNLCFCMCFVSALYVMFLIKEYQSRAKLLQFVGGVRILTFWLSHFVWDLFTYTITALIVIITLACFQEDGY